MKMIDLFNTAFEISLRILLTLEIAKGKRFTADMIAATDFITVYGHDFGIAENNLHGENNFKFGEFALRRELVKEAVKNLVLDGFVGVDSTKDGFVYYISDTGKKYAATFNSTYAAQYRNLSQTTQEHLSGKSERDILRLINKRSVLSLQRGEING